LPSQQEKKRKAEEMEDYHQPGRAKRVMGLVEQMTSPAGFATFQEQVEKEKS
jgi:hypothetical protein